jgi:ribonuclease D
LERFFRALDQKTVVFHGADYDLRMLGRHGTFHPASIFDTMLAARLVGEPQVGLAALLEKFFGIQLCKASQKANWAQRPLSQQMTSYALSDVDHLLELADRLQQKLGELGRMLWLEESVERMIHSANNPKEKDPEKSWKISGASKLSPRAQAVVRALWHWRDSEAKLWDRPPFYVMSNQDILRIAEASVAGEAFSTPRFPIARRERFERTLELALDLPESDWPVTEKTKRFRPDPGFARRFEALKNKRDAVAKELGLESSLIAPKASLEAIAGGGGPEVLMRWQQELLDIAPPVMATSQAAK